LFVLLHLAGELRGVIVARMGAGAAVAITMATSDREQNGGHPSTEMLT
jgi:hypothetical protein